MSHHYHCFVSTVRHEKLQRKKLFKRKETFWKSWPPCESLIQKSWLIKICTGNWTTKKHTVKIFHTHLERGSKCIPVVYVLWEWVCWYRSVHELFSSIGRQLCVDWGPFIWAQFFSFIHSSFRYDAMPSSISAQDGNMVKNAILKTRTGCQSWHSYLQVINFNFAFETCMAVLFSALPFLIV